jgi:ketosteroid isomerase-like protein
VLALLQRYRAALESKDLASLKGIWPSMGGGQEKAIRDSFQFTRSMQVDLQAGDVQIAGDQATVRCRRHDEMVSVDGQKAQTDTAPTFQLRRKGDSWIIEAIR